MKYIFDMSSTVKIDIYYIDMPQHSYRLYVTVNKLWVLLLYMLCRLIDILADHKDKKGLSGVVLINGQKQPENFRCKSAYVVQVTCEISKFTLVCRLFHFQDDFLMGTLTIRENIAFSAALRLSSRYNKKQRREKVNQVIKELRLTHVADSKVASTFIME